MILTDELAAALNALVNDLNGYKNCDTIRAMTADANAVLAKYASAKTQEDAQQADSDAQRWARIQEHHPELWQEWLSAGRVTFHLWLQERYPSVWAEYVKSKS